MGVKALHNGGEHCGDNLRVYKSYVLGLVAAASDVFAVGDTGRDMGGTLEGKIERVEASQAQGCLAGRREVQTAWLDAGSGVMCQEKLARLGKEFSPKAEMSLPFHRLWVRGAQTSMS